LKLAFLSVLLASTALASPPPPVPAPAAVVRVPRPPKGVVPEGATLAFVLYDVGKDRLVIVGDGAKAYVPASTYKLPNTLIGLKSGVITGEQFALKWDGKPREREAWNRDHTLPTAMKESVVWFYQEVARRIGLERMRTEVEAFGYGNREIGKIVDRFWLDGPLAISPVQQVEFLRRLRAASWRKAVPWALPVSQAHAALTEKIITRREKDGWIFRGKTGAMRRENAPERVNWLVGFVDGPSNTWIYATLITGPASRGEAMFEAREPVTLRMLAQYGVGLP
jgi:beta-lactamase class D